MKKSIALLSLLFCVESFSQEISIPDELKPFIMPGYEVLDVVKGDLNNDKRQDYLLVLKTAGEDTFSFDNTDWDANRPLLLITRQANGTLKTVAVNNELIFCKNCGGVMGDPYQGLVIKPGEFTAELYGGSSWHWEETFTFRYDAVKKNWFLQTHKSVSFQSGDPEKTMNESVISRSEIGDISIEKFTTNYNADSSSWKVKAPRTYFFKSPVIGSKPGKAYLVKGNKLISFKQFRNFVECSFTNSKGTVTTGYILKKDLELLEAGKPSGL
jgi:hypothetical protein